MPDVGRPIKLEDEARLSLFGVFGDSVPLAGAVSYNLFQLADAPVELGRPADISLSDGWEYQFQVPSAVAGDDWWFRVFFQIGQAGPEEVVYVTAILGRQVRRGV